MTNMKFLYGLAALITIIVMAGGQPSRPGDKIHFQDSSELKENLEIDSRSSGPQQHRERNHRGRSPLQPETRNNVPQFEQGIPGLYPLKGPPQAPLVLPSRNYSDTTNTLVFATQPKTTSPATQQTPKYYHYAGNPFLAKYMNEPTTTTTNTNKFSSTPGTGAVTNQLPNSDKPHTTTPNPRLTNLLYGSNLLVDESNAGQGAGNTTTDVNFGDRGIFDTAPHCKANEILVKNKCRPKV